MFRFLFFFLLSVVSAAVPEPTTTRTTHQKLVGVTANTTTTTTTTTRLVPTKKEEEELRRGGGDLQQPQPQGSSSSSRMQDDNVKDPWSRMGGGAINEKPRRGTTLHHQQQQQPPHRESSLPQQPQQEPRTHGFDPQTHQAHLYHALEGLHRYPNYLSRFSDESDLDALEQALQQQLQTVQSQRQRQRRHKQAWQQLVADYWKEHNDRTAAPPSSSSSPQQQDTKDQRYTDKDDDNNTKQFNDKKRMDLLLQEGPTSWEQLIHYVLHPRLVQTLLFQSPQFRVSSSSNKKKKKQRPTIHQVLTGTVSIHYTAGSLEQFLYRHGANDYYDDDDDSMDEDSMNDDDTMTSVSFPLLQREFCNAIVQYRQGLVDRVSRRQQEQEQQLSSSSSCPDSDDDCLLLASLLRRPLDLDTIGLSWINDLLLQLVVRPLARHLYSNHNHNNKGNGWDLDWRQGYIAAYAPQPETTWDKPRQHLVTHTDDSEVTLNLGLGPHKRLQGSGAVELRGIRGGTEEGRLVHSYHPRQGRALLHIGRRFHNVTPVHHGNRYALILWTRSCRYPYRPTRERKRKTAFKYESIVFCLGCVIRTDSFHMCVRNSFFFAGNGVRAQTCPCCWLNNRQDNCCICGPRWN